MEASRSPPPKRRREDDERDTPLNVSSGQEFTKSADLWMEDGNIILLCHSVGFRVHRGVLALHSSVLRDMFSIIAPAEDQIFDGCVVVTLHDAVEDLLLLLKTLYFRRFAQTKSKFRLQTLRRLLEMARKYMVDDLLDEIKDYLRLIFPSTLTVYRSQYRLESLCQDLDPMVGVEIAMEFDFPIIRPAAPYMSSLIRLETRLDGFKSSDGSRSPQLVDVLRPVFVFERNLREHMEDDEHNDRWYEERTCENKALSDLRDEFCPGLPAWLLSYARRWRHNLSADIFLDGYSELDEVCDKCISKLREMEGELSSSLWSVLPMLDRGSGWSDWRSIPQ
ncbi:hypothetical protein BV25DRAFT_1806771 [Artomyces pyxidatus]|uniref:Uncharacterized protein n=1 Tax=Artomyces pyxidatus TaxID=48021 RepID=A0ACB8SVZ4_9AGAM|nr:hypothetical protein BV25DRAFT_1806771 [Artomyces pyxidatus]